MGPLGEVLNELMARLRISRALAGAGIPPRVTGLDYEFRIPSGFVDIDRLLGGLPRPSLIAIGGGSVEEKTTFGVAVARNVSVRLNLRTVFFSLAISRWQIARRFLSAESQVDSTRIDDGRLSESDLRRLGDGLDVLSRAPVYIDDSPAISAGLLQDRVAFLHAEQPLDLVIIDQLETVSPTGSHAVAHTGSMSCDDQNVRTLKSLSRELNSPILALFETLPGRPIGKQEDAMIELVPDSLVQHCDCIALLDRADDDCERTGLLNFHVVKNRDGPNGLCSLLFIERTGRLLDLGEELPNDRNVVLAAAVDSALGPAGDFGSDMKSLVEDLWSL